MSPTLPGWLAAGRRILRQQRRSAGATLLIVLTLALALGANTAMFGIADALLLRAVPFRDPGGLVAVTIAFPGIKLTGMNLSGPEAMEFSRLTSVFSGSGPYSFTGLVVQGGSEAELANGVQVSLGAINALDVQPFAGRPFGEHEYLEGAAPVAILGHGLWTRAFGADPSVIGRVVQLGGVSREVVGIMPDRLSLLNRPVDVWLPLATDTLSRAGRSDHGYSVVARLAEGRTLVDAAADVRRAMAIWRDETGEMHVPTERMHPLELQPLAKATTGISREPVGALLAAVAFVLLIACANISNLLVARAERRRADVAVQLALGATRRHLLADSLVEGLGLAVAGSVGGLLVAQLIIEAVRATWPVAATASVGLDYRVLGAAAVLTALTGLLIGAVPILRLDLARAGEWLKGGARGSVGTPGRMHLQRGLIVLQIGLAVLLSAGAGLMVRSLLEITAIDSGLNVTGVVRAQVSLPAGAYPEDPQVWAFYERVLERLRALPDVTSAAVMSGLPPQRRANNTSFFLDGNETMDHTAIHQIDFVQHISPDYLSTLSLRLRSGRALTAADDEGAAPAALVNETLARRFWPTDTAIGHRLKPAGNVGTWFTVVGVVSDSRQNGIQSPVGAEIYVTHRQARRLMSGFMPRAMNVVVRSSGDTDRMTAAIRSAVRGVDPSAAVSGLATMQTIIDRTIAQPRLLAWMFGAFAVLALVVAGVGVYAVTAYAVSARTSEFGVRMALGARARDVIGLVVAGGVPTVLAGLVLGTGSAILAARLVGNLLFGIEPLDLLSLASASAAIAVTALLATVLPAWRAARVDPLTALRE